MSGSPDKWRIERWLVVVIGSSNLSVPEPWLFYSQAAAERAIANPKGESRGWRVLHGPELVVWQVK